MTEARPAWLDQFVWSVLWKVVAVSLATVLLLLLVREPRHLLLLLVVSSFFALAMIPGVERTGVGDGGVGLPSASSTCPSSCSSC